MYFVWLLSQFSLVFICLYRYSLLAYLCFLKEYQYYVSYCLSAKVAECNAVLQMVLDYTYLDETLLVDAEFPPDSASRRIAAIQGKWLCLLHDLLSIYLQIWFWTVGALVIVPCSQNPVDHFWKAMGQAFWKLLWWLLLAASSEKVAYKFQWFFWEWELCHPVAVSLFVSSLKRIILICQ